MGGLTARSATNRKLPSSVAVLLPPSVGPVGVSRDLASARTCLRAKRTTANVTAMHDPAAKAHGDERRLALPAVHPSEHDGLRRPLCPSNAFGRSGSRRGQRDHVPSLRVDTARAVCLTASLRCRRRSGDRFGRVRCRLGLFLLEARTGRNRVLRRSGAHHPLGVFDSPSAGAELLRVLRADVFVQVESRGPVLRCA